MSQLKEESKKSLELQSKLKESEMKSKTQEIDPKEENNEDVNFFKLPIENDSINNFFNKSEIENLIMNKNYTYETQLKSSLNYFYKKFKSLYQKMTEMEIQASDDLNKWLVKEENYKAEISKLKTNSDGCDEDDSSDISPGIVTYYPNSVMLKRKCSYLEESYKYIRTMNENIKNEYLDYKRDIMISFADYESKIQTLILRVTSLTDKLRNSISLDIFLKQNQLFHEQTTKYRILIEKKTLETNYANLLKKLDADKLHVINILQKQSTNSKYLII